MAVRRRTKEYRAPSPAASSGPAAFWQKLRSSGFIRAIRSFFAGINASYAEPSMPRIFSPKIFEPRKKAPSFILEVLFKSIKYGIIALIILGFIGTGVVFGIAKSYLATAPELDLASLTDSDLTTMIYSSKGELLSTYANIENRVWASYDELPKNLVNAIISIEDTRFWTHPGIDTKRIVGALVNNLTGSSTHGGSTITQQLIKMKILSDEQTLRRKIQEAYLALELENKYTKEQILEAYLNTIPLGGSNYGVKSAAWDYFGKGLDELTLRECAMLAGITNNPSYYNPRLNMYVRDNMGATDRRTNTVLLTMYQSGRISLQEYHDALNDEVTILEKSPTSSNREMLYFVEYVIKDVIDRLISARGLVNTSENRSLIEKELRTSGYRIYTTLDPDFQGMVEDVIFNWDSYPSTLNQSDSVITQTSATGMTIEVIQPQCSLVVMDQHTGWIKAIIGGRSEPVYKRGLNRAYQSAMPIGSSIKPIAVYAPAMDLGKNAGSCYYNVRMAIPGWNSELGFPRNYNDRNYTGLSTLRSNLIASANVVAAQALLFDVGFETSGSYLEQLGIDTSSDNIVLDGSGLALGSNGVSMMDLTAAYCALGNGGYYIEPISFTRITDENGSVVYDAEAAQTRRKVFKDSTVYMMTDILTENIRTSSTGARIPNMTVAGKTGTNSDSRGISFAGYTPYYTAALYIGSDNYKPLVADSTGGRYCIPLWQAVMAKIHEGLENRPIYEGEPEQYNLVKAVLCADSGMLYTEECKHFGCKSRTDYIALDSPEYQNCTMHRKYGVCIVSGKYATKYCPSSTVRYEYVKAYDETSVIAKMTDEFRKKYAVGMETGRLLPIVYLNAYDTGTHLDEVCNVHTREWYDLQQGKDALIAEARNLISRVNIRLGIAVVSDDVRGELAARISMLNRSINSNEEYSSIRYWYDYLKEYSGQHLGIE
ncbi:MAG: transglycosylase domain-containing protein [Eubacteriales bacterium]|nr:transglycosylase domain-containing protein [Eubacteriales bacterium]